MFFPDSRRVRSGNHGAVLLICLMAMALLTVLVIGFLAAESLRNQTAFSSYGQQRAQSLALTAERVLRAELQQEIYAGSVNNHMGNAYFITEPNLQTNVVGGVTVVSPYRANMIPFRFNPNFTNVVRWSGAGSNSWSTARGGYYGSATPPIRAYSDPNDSSASNSVDSYGISPARWNYPQLMSSGPLPSQFVPPSWCLITRAGSPSVSGAITPALLASYANKGTTTTPNASYAIGRFAYVIYDEGGLLDANIAGSPTTATGTDPTPPTAADLARHGYLSFADLTQIPGVANATAANAFTSWRNLATAPNYTNYVLSTGATNGFLVVAPGDQRFINRQDLINYAVANPTILSTNALPYLTTFTRETNASSYAPSFAPFAPTNSTIAYATIALTNQSSTASPNYDVLRVTSSSTSPPLLQNRFPLAKLAELSSGPGSLNPAQASAILADFGLEPDPYDNGVPKYQWHYAGGPGGSSLIETLAQVATENRSPNFFELLKAGIASGSVGLSSYVDAADGSYVQTRAFLDFMPDRQILQIGANIIDQFDSDSWPTLIRFDGQEPFLDPYARNDSRGQAVQTQDAQRIPVAGTESLPYVSEILYSAYNAPSGTNVDFHYQVEMWNPHQNASVLPTNGPTNLRLVAVGGGSQATYYFATYSDGYTDTTRATYGDDYVGNPTGTPAQLDFTNSTVFSEPTVLTPALATSPDPAAVVSTSTGSYIGITIGILTNAAGFGQAYHTVLQPVDGNPTVSVPPYVPNLPPPGPPPAGTGGYLLDLEAQFMAPNGNWYCYQKIPYISGRLGGPDQIGGGAQIIESINNLDPRCNRWGMFGAVNITPTPAVESSPNASLYDPTYTMWRGTIGRPYGPTFNPSGVGTIYVPGYSGSWASIPWMATMADNDPNETLTNAMRYADVDSVMRQGDGRRIWGVYPTKPNDPLDRPLILNRPFRSVGELGYAFRDEPYKTLDLWTPSSGDMGLLDLFCLQPPAQGYRAGVFNLNTVRPEVLASVLSGSALDEESPTTTISAASAQTIAADYVANLNANGPFMNKAEALASFSAYIQNKYTGAYPARKTEREAIARSLAEPGETRTWNLMIDVIVQAGHFKPTPSTLADFKVEGEQRYWIHLAIDRFTGQVTDEVWEPVYE